MSSTSWIVSANPRLSQSLWRLLELQIGESVHVVTLEQWRQRQLPDDNPQWLFLDLDDPSSWDELVDIRAHRTRFNGAAIPVVGIVSRGFPVERASLADWALSATIYLPFSGVNLADLLTETTIGQLVKDQNHLGESRSLEGSTRRLTTYTPSLFPMLEELEVVARCNFTVLLIGETGTGKTTLARLIHELSPCHKSRFLTVACGSLPGELIDSELFGHVKGAFTGAERTNEGKFDVADGGTILLDEIDVLGTLQQAKLLRVLETGEYEPVGSNDTHTSNARAIVASNVSLETLIAENSFRADLFFRLNQVKFEIPPLRRRPRDIVPLAMNFIAECCSESDLTVEAVHPDMLRVLKQYNWPGNLRQLRNEIRRAVLFSRGGVLMPSHLSPGVLAELSAPEARQTVPPYNVGLAGEVAQAEQYAIEQMLRTQNFNRAATARALGISRVTLYNKIRKYRIRVDGAGRDM